MHPDKPLKALFNRQQEWLTFLNKHIGHVREAVIENVRKERDWRHFLDSQYQRYWKVHFAKKTDNILQTVSYLGRYLKRPPVSASRLRHYSKGAC
ncbi:hypothetical protein C9J12_19355 [Photobacterium frigidiphilum]|uniref:Transposase IS801/IS1294 domain-containing protein n=1 Tax=Photobacterium frigidiphilum TaxID=264736 RepID=A0A2T3JBM3_9GAMM|nr:hypothetical protein C9J12_19355 [Photobacterium frigidiphilum]